MWKLKQIKAKNLGSFKDVEISLVEGVCTLITGENLDDEGQESNGSGKSLILETISLVTTGEVFRKDARPVDLIRDGEDESPLSLLFVDTLNEEKTLYIERTIYRTKTAIVKIKESHKQGNTTKSGISEYNEEILHLIGLSKQDLLSYFIIHKEKTTPFLMCTDTKKKEVIVRFANLGILEGINAKVDKEIATLVTSISSIDTQVVSEESSLATYEVEKKNHLKNRESLYQEQKNQIQAEINDLIKDKEQLQSDKELELILDKKRKQKLFIYQMRYSKFVDLYTPLLDECKEDHAFTKKQIKDLEDENSKEVKFFSLEKQEESKLKIKIAGEIACPKCDHKFILGDKNNTLEEYKIQLINLQIAIKATEGRILTIANDLTECKEVLEEIELIINGAKKDLDRYNTLLFKCDWTITNLTGDIESLKNTLERYDRDIKKVSDKITTLKTKKLEVDKGLDSVLIRYDKQIESIKTKILTIKQSKEDLQSSIVNKEDIKTAFSKFKVYLVNKTLNTISSFTNHYLNKMGSGMSINLNGYRYLADGKTLREEIETEIFRDGMPCGLFGRFSSGEKVRLIVANILALQKIINITSPTGGLDLLFLDEIVESVDSQGIKGLVKAINLTQQTVEIITFSQHNILGVPNLIVRKKDGEAIPYYKENS